MPNAGLPNGAHVRVLIALLFAIQLVSMGAMEMSGPFWPVHLRAMTFSDAWFSVASVLVYVGPMLGIMLTSIFWGRIGDRYGHKLMMIRALAGLALTQLALAFANDIWLILLLRFLQGAFAGYIAPAQAYGVSIEAPNRRARLFAILQISTNVGSLLGALVGGLILDHASFFWINISAAGLCAVCTLVAALTLPNVAPSAAKPLSAGPAPSAVAWHRAPLLPLLVLLGIVLLARLLPQTAFPLYVTTVFAASNSLVGLCYGLFALGFIVFAAPWARYFEHRGQAGTLQRMGYVIGACLLVTLLAALTRHIAVFLAVYFCWGALLGATTPVLMAVISKTADSSQQGQVLGIAQSTSQFASIAGISLGGLLSQMFGQQHIYFFVVAAYGVALLALWQLRGRFIASNPSANAP